jgi:hypothetical protein
MSAVPRPTTAVPTRIRQLGAACAWMAAGGMLLFVLMRFGSVLVDMFAHGDTGWLRLLIIVVALAGADVGGLMLILYGLKLFHRALGASGVGKASLEKER